MPGELTTAIGAIGDPEGVRELGVEGMAGVDRVVPISRPYKLASSELYHDGPSVFDIGGRRVGGGDTFCLIAGPCTVESREQTLGVARAVKAAGASMLRGGALSRAPRRSRSRPGRRGVAILGEARAETGLPVVTELLDASTPTSSPSTPTSCRSARATCRTTRCSRSRASSASRRCSSAG